MYVNGMDDEDIKQGTAAFVFQNIFYLLILCISKVLFSQTFILKGKELSELSFTLS